MMKLMRSKTNQRFALLEVLIALAVFAIGLIGISKISTSALRSSVDNNNRSVSLNTASQILIPVYLAANNNPEDFKNQILAFAPGIEVLNNGDRDKFTISIAEAFDDAGTNLLKGKPKPETWISPITVGVKVTFVTLRGPKSIHAPFTFYVNKP